MMPPTRTATTPGPAPSGPRKYGQLSPTSSPPMAGNTSVKATQSTVLNMERWITLSVNIVT